MGHEVEDLDVGWDQVFRCTGPVVPCFDLLRRLPNNGVCRIPGQVGPLVCGWAAPPPRMSVSSDSINHQLRPDCLAGREGKVYGCRVSGCS